MSLLHKAGRGRPQLAVGSVIGGCNFNILQQLHFIDGQWPIVIPIVPINT